MRYSFDEYVLDLERRELVKSGRPIDIEPQVFDLLVFLIRNRERVVSRDDLIAGVWGGRIVSESALASRVNAVRRAIGDDGTAQRLVKTMVRKGFRFVGDVRENAEGAALQAPSSDSLAQTISFCRTSDGVNIAVATVGEGPVLVKTAHWLTHIEHDWQSPLWSPMFRRLAARFRLVRYDGRGSGLSDRDAADISQAGFVSDLDAVIDSLDADRFTLLGLSQGAAAAAMYAARHPDRVTRLILYGAYAQGRNRRGSPEDAATGQTLLAMMQQGWGREDSAFMRAFSSLYLTDAPREQIKWFADLQRLSATGTMAARIRTACDDIDITAILPEIKVPTLIIHARHDHVVPLEQGRQIAAGIPGAKFVILDSENHILVPGGPAWDTLLSEIEAFAVEA
jgi:pimeloyl-ACP methyl ester carboxylesterase